MKQKFSTSWLSSKQVRKQRKYRYNAPLHVRHRFLSANLSKELRKKYGKRSVPVRKGDEALIMRGSSAKKKGKILTIDMKKGRVTLDGLNRNKGDGTKVDIYFNPSNLQSLDLGDSKRLKSVKREVVEKKEEKPKEKKEEKQKEKIKEKSQIGDNKKHVSDKSKSK
jgi:large subunit ribosomal protein L24